MLVGMPRISTAFKDSRWSSSVVTPQNPHAICIQHYYGIREKESGSRTCPSFEDTTVGRSVCKRAPREYLYTTLDLVAVEECSGRGTIRLYEATCISRHAPSKSARFIISLVSTATTNLDRLIRGTLWFPLSQYEEYTHRMKTVFFLLFFPFSFLSLPGERSRTKRSENSVGDRLIVIIKFQHNGERGGGYEISTNVILSSAE